MGCDLALAYRPHPNAVSTHAPVWGAIQLNKVAALALIVSTHAPVWGAILYGYAIDFSCPFQHAHSTSNDHPFHSSCDHLFWSYLIA
ncbi:hypothetical protein [Moraxella bovoculi]